MAHYTTAAPAVNPSAQVFAQNLSQVRQDRLPARLVSFYQWLVKLARQTGFCWASNGYLAKKQGVDDSTITRWVARLRAVGWVRCEHVPGVERHIHPLRPAPRTRRAQAATPEPAEGPAEGLRGVPPPTPSIQTDASRNHTADTTDAPANPQAVAVVARVVAQGVSRPVAARLVAEHGPDAVAAQLAALPHRQARDHAAVLVAAIRQSWSLPARLQEAREAARRQTEQHARENRARAEAECLARERAALQRDFDALPAPVRADIEAQARAAVARDHPVVWRLGPDRRACAALLRAACLALHQARHMPAPPDSGR